MNPSNLRSCDVCRGNDTVLVPGASGFLTHVECLDCGSIYNGSEWVEVVRV